MALIAAWFIWIDVALAYQNIVAGLPVPAGRLSGETSLLAKDKVARERIAYAENPEPHFLTYGPKTRREFLSLPQR